jgi:hypothetical protein
VELTVLRVEDLRAGNVGGQEVGRERDTYEAGAERLRQRLHRQRFRQPGHTFDQHVAVT